MGEMEARDGRDEARWAKWGGAGTEEKEKLTHTVQSGMFCNGPLLPSFLSIALSLLQQYGALMYTKRAHTAVACCAFTDRKEARTLEAANKTDQRKRAQHSRLLLT